MAWNPIVIEKGLNARFAQEMARFYEAREVSPGIMASVMVVQSNGAYEKMGWLGAMPTVQQWIGALDAKELADYDYTIRNKDWVASVPINENDLDDDQIGVLNMIPQALAQRIMKHPGYLMTQLLIDGTTNLAYDGVAFFSDVSAPRDIDNLLAGTGVTLSALGTDLESAMVAMAKFDDNQNEPLNIRGNMIVCPVALERNFKRLVSSIADPNASAGTNTFNPFANEFIIVSDPRLDADDANDWYLLATNEIVKPLIFSNRQNAKNRMEKIPGVKKWNYSADYRGNGGYGLPHLAVKTVNS
jgi:phage major head subunit gpT-like protein